ncbi:hypothetical protein COCMIDRAFT_38881 [Bipolaris oryzae ATCC 44560]|uniref:Uncharacterized protein n=1 Tax=Bipolaris oryzae ATCC 44560 TaxID=930090 RepID=W6YZW6_COCMI|nr:uncharacterized protein COCMIDRAFT_38881 [Bipolaris oryzae ATCC 44560]EUC43150.1 hypothetical protein COCMIDRAFT_38881 [Bipolaris oryzae ATCC 44560]
MRASIAIIATITSQIVHAQFGMDMFPGSMISGSMATCQDGHVPTLTCENPVPESCACTCSDGLTFNQSRPPVVDPVPPPVEPPVEPPHQLDEKPCTTEIIQSWARLELHHKIGSYEPSEMKTKDISFPEDTVLVVADAARRCQHFEVSIDGKVIGQTYGKGPLDYFDCGTVDNCINNHEGSVGYFTLPKDYIVDNWLMRVVGNHVLGMRWVGITEPCKDIEKALGYFQIYKPC